MYKKTIAVFAVVMMVLMSIASVAYAADDPKENFDVVGESSEMSSSEGNSEETGGEQTTVKMYGDVNDDKVVDVNDVTEYQLILVGSHEPTEAFERNGDANADTKKNIWDVTTMQYYIAGTFKKLPVTTDGYYAEIIRP